MYFLGSLLLEWAFYFENFEARKECLGFVESTGLLFFLDLFKDRVPNNPMTNQPSLDISTNINYIL